MHPLRISCFGILLKHHLLRHHADEIALKGRLRPAAETALAGIPADFEVHLPAPLPEVSRSQGEEQRLALHLDFRRAAMVEASDLALSVQGILARRGAEGTPCLNPFSIHLLAAQDPVSRELILHALASLARGEWHASIGTEVRVGLFRPPFMEAPPPILVRVV